MTDAAVPGAVPRRFRVGRGGLIAGIVALVLVVLAAVGWWVSALQPFTAAGFTTVPRGLTPVHPNSREYAWHRGGTFTVTLYLHNSASIPVTVTGVDGDTPGWEGAWSGPSIGRVDTGNDTVALPFHPVHIAAGGEAPVAFVFRANPKACRLAVSGTSDSSAFSTVVGVNVHFTALGIVHDTAFLPLESPRPMLREPDLQECASP
jgi:hypothetical protein